MMQKALRSLEPSAIFRPDVSARLLVTLTRDVQGSFEREREQQPHPA